MYAILIGVLILSVGYCEAAEIACSDGNGTKTTFTPYNDGVVGRYLAQWCINVDPRAPRPTSWSLQLTYFPTDHYCRNPPLNNVYSQGKVHSLYTEPSFIVDGNCTHVCLNATVDLVFKSCYLLKTWFMVSKLRRYMADNFFNIENEYSEELFKNNTALVNVVHHDKENVTIEWHTGVPFHSCDFELTLKNSSMGETRLVKVEAPADCTAPSQTEVRCSMRLRPGEYHTQLNLYAPWIHGVFRDQEIVTYDFNVTAKQGPTVQSSRTWLWMLVGGLASLGVVFVAARCACHSRRARAVRKKVLEKWLVQRNESSPVPPVKSQRHILMLYARECEAASKFCAALRDMLQEAPDTQVYDIFSPEVMAMAASGPHAWVRGMLLRSDVAVLLLQTPALAALYQQHLQDSDNALRLQEPLLGRRVLYRSPQYGDTLLQYAILLTAEAAHARSNYHKYYIASLSELPTDIFPQLVPYRRYSLPGAAPLLAQQLCDLTPSRHSLDTLTLAAREFTDLAKDNPDYLMEQLMLIP